MDPAGERVEHHGAVELALPGGVLSDVGDPQLIRSGSGERLDSEPSPQTRCRTSQIGAQGAVSAPGQPAFSDQTSDPVPCS